MSAPRSTGAMTVAGRTRLAVVGVAALSVVLAALVVYVAWLQYTVRVRTDELARQVVAISRGLAAGEAIDPAASQPLEGIRARLFEVEAGLIGARLVLTDAEGAVVHSSAPEETLAAYDLQRLTGTPDERGVRTGVRPLPSAGRVIVVASPVEGAAGTTYLLAIQPVRELADARRGGALILLATALIAVFGAWVVGGIVARRITAPVVHLREATEAVTAGAWGRQVPVEGDEEVAALARSFNEMSERVDAAYHAQREFVGDVSHELRTPITSIQGFAGALLDGVATDDAQREHFARVIRRESSRLMELTNTLLALSDLDSGRVVLAREPVDTGAVAESLRVRHDASAVERGVSFEVGDLGAGGRPLGDEERLLQVASALVTNALAHTPAEGRVRVSGGVQGGRWRLVVEDSGPGVPAAERERIFERFVRLDASRASVSGGSGLGLSICRRLVELMGGTIAVEVSEFGGARFVVALDAA